MRQLLLSTAVCCLLLATGAQAQSVSTPPQSGRSLFYASQLIGVDTHLAYTDGFGMYADETTLLSALSYLGVNQLRDGLPTNQLTTMPGYTAAANIERLAALGYQFDLVFADNTRPIAYERANLDQLFAGVGGEYDGPSMKPGAVRIVEGLNEITNENPAPSIATATAWQRNLLCLTRAAAFCASGSVDANVAGALVAEFTSNGPIPTTPSPSVGFPADLMNAHPYAAPSNQYGRTIGQIIAGAFLSDYGVTPAPVLSIKGASSAAPPAVMTESGAYTETPSTTRTDLQYLNSYDPDTVAIKDLDTLLDGLAIGAPTFLYQLFDNYTFDSDNQYGLFTYGGTDSHGDPVAVPTPAATAIHNFTTIGRLPGTVPFPTANNCLLHTVSGLPSGASTLMIQIDNSGDYGIVMWWDNPNDWNKNTHEKVAVTPVPVTLAFADTAQGFILDPIQGTSPISQYGNTTRLTVPLADDPLVVVVHTANPNETCN